MINHHTRAHGCEQRAHVQPGRQLHVQTVQEPGRPVHHAQAVRGPCDLVKKIQPHSHNQNERCPMVTFHNPTSLENPNAMIARIATATKTTAVCVLKNGFCPLVSEDCPMIPSEPKTESAPVTAPPVADT